MSVSEKYILVKKLNSAPFQQLVITRLRAEGIEVRVRNSMSASIYALDSIEINIEVKEGDVERAVGILAQMEEDAEEQTTDLDYSDADAEDIEFEKQVYEHEQRLANAKPPIVLILILLLICVIFALFINSSR